MTDSQHAPLAGRTGSPHAPLLLRAALCLLMAPLTLVCWQSLADAQRRRDAQLEQARDVDRLLDAYDRRAARKPRHVAKERLELTRMIGEAAARLLATGSITQISASTPQTDVGHEFRRCVTRVVMAGVPVGDALRLAESIESVRPSVTVSSMSIGRDSSLDEWTISMALEDRVAQ